MSLFPSGFNSPAALSGPCLVKFFAGASGSLGNAATTIDTLQMCTAGAKNFNAIAGPSSSYSCDYTSSTSVQGEAITAACGLAALNATLTSNSGTFTLYNAATTNTYTLTTVTDMFDADETAIPSQLVLVPNAASISNLIVTPTSGASLKAANVPTLAAALGVVSSLLFSGLF